MSLYPRYYELKICPVCREQVEEDYDYGTHHHHQGYWGYIEPVTIKIPVPDRVEQAIGSELVQGVLKEKVREQECRDAQMEWWRSLPQEEQDRREAERRAGLSPMARMLEDHMRTEVERVRRAINKPAFWTDAEIEAAPGTVIPTTKEGD